jgi:glycosyltransferase involved in cell wall biosynthesis
VARTDRRELRFALVHDWLTVPGGSEDVLREVCDLYPGVVFTSQWDRSRIRFLKDREVRTSAIQSLPWALSRHYLYAPVLPGVYRNFRLDEFDVVLSDSHSFAHGVRQRPGALHVCYYHTPARSLWVPEVDDRATSGPLAPLKRLIAQRLRRLDLAASRNPDVLIANSETTAERIRRFYGREVERVIYPPVDTQKWADVGHESDAMGLLYWGRLVRYKRVDLLIEAVRRTGDRLQIVGAGPSEEALKAQAAGMPNVTFHGRLSDADLKVLMAQCRAFAFPAYEDFGIVAVEAMAAGMPVVCYGVGGAAESVTPEFGVRFGVQTADAVVEAIRLLGTKEFDPAATRAHAARFDVSRFRREYRETVDAAIARHFGGPRA